MKNIPKIIYLNIGESLEEIDDFNDLQGVTWTKKIRHPNLSYYRKEIVLNLMKKSYNAGIDSCADYERYSGELEEFEDWFNRNYK